MSAEAERFAGARIQADAKRASQPTRQQQLIARQNAETERLLQHVDLEKYFARGK